MTCDEKSSPRSAEPFVWSALIYLSMDPWRREAIALFFMVCGLELVGSCEIHDFRRYPLFKFQIGTGICDWCAMGCCVVSTTTPLCRPFYRFRILSLYPFHPILQASPVVGKASQQVCGLVFPTRHFFREALTTATAYCNYSTDEKWKQRLILIFQLHAMHLVQTEVPG